MRKMAVIAKGTKGARPTFMIICSKCKQVSYSFTGDMSVAETCDCGDEFKKIVRDDSKPA